jgi:hypothetical protein
VAILVDMYSVSKSCLEAASSGGSGQSTMSLKTPIDFILELEWRDDG